MPQWYPPVASFRRAALWLNADFFELLDRFEAGETYWVEWALTAAIAEDKAVGIKRKWDKENNPQKSK